IFSCPIFSGHYTLAILCQLQVRYLDLYLQLYPQDQKSLKLIKKYRKELKKMAETLVLVD
ncbi:MAG: hypothetical protein ACD_20C00042G0018, partial [uncultured bacterium]